MLNNNKLTNEQQAKLNSLYNDAIKLQQEILKWNIDHAYLIKKNC